MVEIDGNRATINDGERQRIRDKNKLKFIPERPTYLLTKRSATSRQIPRREADIYIDVSSMVPSTVEPAAMEIVEQESSVGDAEDPLSVQPTVSQPDTLGAEELGVVEPTTFECVVPEPSLGEALLDDAMIAGASAEVPLHASLEAKTAEDASFSMEEHLQQLLRAAEERENEERENVDAATPAPRRRGRPSKQGRQFRGYMKKKQ